MNLPDDLKYTDHDEWIRLEGDIITIGISDYAQDALGELVHVELPEVGQSFSAGEAICEVESVKAVADVYTPLDGEVVEINEALDGGEEAVNEDPYGKGWLVKLRVGDTSALDQLLDVQAYREKIAD